MRYCNRLIFRSLDEDAVPVLQEIKHGENAGIFGICLQRKLDELARFVMGAPAEAE